MIDPDEILESLDFPVGHAESEDGELANPELVIEAIIKGQANIAADVYHSMKARELPEELAQSLAELSFHVVLGFNPSEE